MNVCKKHSSKCKPCRGTINVEIRCFTQNDKIKDSLNTFTEDDECPKCFVEYVNRQLLNDGRVRYYNTPAISRNIVIPRPRSYEEFQIFIATNIPNTFGPAVVETRDGSQIFSDQDAFMDGETYVFREIRPSTMKDFDVKIFYDMFQVMHESCSYESYFQGIMS
mmetsp:Transcript_9871/g.10938  ORF Transcript_9871/g.10938 Transcript_9871/m.10938 type:complete len:164 (-) Transcript_9871:82-573(-)